jgi:hypothetical protein
MSAPHTAVSDDNVVVVSTEAPKSVAWHDHHGMELTHVREFEPRCVFRASPSTHDRTPWGDPPINPISRFPTRDRPFCQKKNKNRNRAVYQNPPSGSSSDPPLLFPSPASRLIPTTTAE